MRVVPAPQIEENNILHFSVETDMEINHPMFIKKVSTKLIKTLTNILISEMLRMK